MPLGLMVRGSYFKPGTIATGRLARAREASEAACSPRTMRPPHVGALPSAAPAGAGEAPPRSRVWKRVGPNHVEPVNVVAGVSDGAFTEIRPVRPGELTEGTLIAIGMRVADQAAGAGLSLGAGRRRAN